MLKAIVIAGNARSFSLETEAVSDYLQKELNIARRRIRSIQSCYVESRLIENCLAQATYRETDDPLLVAYNGHGSEKGWAIDDRRRIFYREAIEWLENARRPVLVVSDCCYAMALAAACSEARVPTDKVGIIGAAAADGLTKGGFLAMVLANWRKRNHLFSTHDLRWGAVLDPHFFPGEPAR